MMNGSGTEKHKEMAERKFNKAMDLAKSIDTDKIKKNASEVLSTLSEKSDTAKRGLKDTYSKTSKYVKEQPVKSAFIAGAVMFLLGMLFKSRKK